LERYSGGAVVLVFTAIGLGLAGWQSTPYHAFSASLAWWLCGLCLGAAAGIVWADRRANADQLRMHDEALKRADLAFAEGEYHRATVETGEALAHSRSCAAHAMMGWCLRSLNDPSGAAYHFHCAAHGARRVNRAQSALLYTLVARSMLDARNHEAALRASDSAIELAGHGTTEVATDAHIARGMSLFMLKREEEAVAEFDWVRTRGSTAEQRQMGGCFVDLPACIHQATVQLLQEMASEGDDLPWSESN